MGETSTLAAIDPGISGAVAVCQGSRVNAIYMPATIHDIAGYFRVLQSASEGGLRVVVEKVGTYMPGNSGPSAAKFARHVGNLEGVLASLRIPYSWVTPAKWEHWLIGKPAYQKIPKEMPKDQARKIRADRKRERKNKIKQRVQELFPHIKITLKNADALGILEWARRNRERSD